MGQDASEDFNIQLVRLHGTVHAEATFQLLPHERDGHMDAVLVRQREWTR